MYECGEVKKVLGNKVAITIYFSTVCTGTQKISHLLTTLFLYHLFVRNFWGSLFGRDNFVLLFEIYIFWSILFGRTWYIPNWFFQTFWKNQVLRRGMLRILKRHSLSLSAELWIIFCDLLASVGLVNKNGCKGQH